MYRSREGFSFFLANSHNRRSALAEATVFIGTRVFHCPIPCRGMTRREVAIAERLSM
jgi:hypothetical protein